MSTEKQRAYEQQLASTDRGARQRAHQMRRQAFSAFLFQVIGNKHVLLTAIQYSVFSAAQPDADRPFSSAEQPAPMLQSFMDAWEEEKTTDDYKKRVDISRSHTKQQGYLKIDAHEARRNLVIGRKSTAPSCGGAGHGMISATQKDLAGRLQLEQTPTPRE